RSTPPAAARAARPLTHGATTRAQRCRADDGRLPPGTVLTRVYKGAVLEVQVLAQGFAYQATVYRSLSAVAKPVTHSHCRAPPFCAAAPPAPAAPATEPTHDPARIRPRRRTPRGPLCRLHAQIDRRRPGPGVQLPRCPTRSRRSLHRQPGAGRLGLPAHPLR